MRQLIQGIKSVYPELLQRHDSCLFRQFLCWVFRTQLSSVQPELCSVHPELCSVHPELCSVHLELCLAHPELCSVHLLQFVFSTSKQFVFRLLQLVFSTVHYYLQFVFNPALSSVYIQLVFSDVHLNCVQCIQFVFRTVNLVCVSLCQVYNVYIQPALAQCVCRCCLCCCFLDAVIASPAAGENVAANAFVVGAGGCTWPLAPAPTPPPLLTIF